MPEDPTIEHKLAIRCRGVTKIAARSRHKRSRRTEILVLLGSARDFDQFPWPFKMHPPKQFQKCRVASFFTVILILVIKNTRFFNVFGDLGILGLGRWDFFAFRCRRLSKKTARRICKGCLVVCPSGCLREVWQDKVDNKTEENQENQCFLLNFDDTSAPKARKHKVFHRFAGSIFG